MLTNRNYLNTGNSKANYSYRNDSAKSKSNSSYVSHAELVAEKNKKNLIYKAFQKKKAFDKSFNKQRTKPFKVPLEQLL
jgi:hypothetical protein